MIHAAVCAKPWVPEHGEAPAWRTLQQEAMQLANNGRMKEALKSFRAALRMERSSENMNNVAVAYGQLGRYRESHEGFVRALNLNANNVGVYDTFLQVRPSLQIPDLPGFLAEERSKRPKPPDSPRRLDETGGEQPVEETCASADYADAVPAAMGHLVNRTNGMRPWGSPTVLVIAHWKEDLSWTTRPELRGFPKVVYQRQDATQALSSPPKLTPPSSPPDLRLISA